MTDMTPPVPTGAGTRPTMRAVRQDEYGDADVLTLAAIPRPTPGAGEVLVRVRAAGVDRGVWHLMTGRPYLVRLMGFGLRRPKQSVRGLDLAGVVETVGDGVTRFRPGDEVYGTGDGSFAEFVVTDASRLAAKPAGLSFEEAAVVPVSASAAWHALHEAPVTEGRRVLVIGASGGVGSYAVQIAKALGAEVTGVCSAAKVELVRSLGADDVLDYSHDDFVAAGPYDVVVDIGGNSSLRRLRRALTPKGTLVIVGGETDGRLLGGFDRQVRAALWSPFVSQRLKVLVSKERSEDLEALTELVEAGRIRPAVDRVVPLAEVPDAIRDLVAGRVRGKVAVAVGA